MKSILYAGAALMIGASIYGFVDYKQTSQKKEFKGMYADGQKTTSPEVVAVSNKKEEVSPVAPVVKKVPLKTQTSKKVENDEKLDPVKPIPGELTLDPTEPGRIEKAEVTVTPKANIKKSKKKKLNSKLFSRAPIREELEVEMIDEGSNRSKKEIKKD